MAKTQQVAGTQLTSQPERIVFANTLMYRDANRNKDARLINCFQESIKNTVTDSKKTYVVKRPGYTQTLQVKSGGGTARGLYYWLGNHYSIIDNGLYKGSTLIQTLATSTGNCGLVDFQNADVDYLFVCDGTDAYVVNAAGTVTKVNQAYSAWVTLTNYSIGDRVIPTVSNGYYYEVTTDAGSSGGAQPTWPTTVGSTVVDAGITWTCKGQYGGFPSPHIPIPKFIDGYMILAESNSNIFHNSDVENIYGWGAGNFATAEMWPDNIIAIARQNNQILILGTTSGEFFYDAASTGGSPFARNEGTVLQMGCAAPYAIYENERFCIFIGESDSGGRAIWLLEGFQPKKKSTEAIERILDAEGTSIVNAQGYGIRTKGHLFFLINLTSCTLVYDLEEDVWHEWSSNSSGNHVPFKFDFEVDTGAGTLSMLHKTDGYIYTLSPSYFTDNGTSILVDAYSMKYDGATYNRKFMHNLVVVADIGSSYTIRWTDDDYVTYNAFKTLNIDRPWFTRCGTFRRRAFNIRHSANEDARIEALEFEVDVGTH